MFNIFHNTIFLLFTLFIGVKSIAYSIYEIKKESNKSGGITLITFSILTLIFVNIVIFSR